jgi:hypothetical protein
MQSIDLDTPQPDPQTARENALEAWRMRRQQRMASPEQFDSQLWLHEAIVGLELAMGSNDPAMTTACLGECLAFGCASVAATSMAAESLRVQLPGESEFVCRHLPCLPRQWLNALMAAVVADDRSSLALLAGATFNQIGNEGEDFAEAFGHALCAQAQALSETGQAIERAASLALTKSDRELVDALTALRQGSSVDYGNLGGLESLSLSTLARRPREAGSGDTQAGAGLGDRGTWPELACLLPARAVLHEREPHWYLDLHGYARGGREHSLVTTSDNRLMAVYTIFPVREMPGVEAPFELTGADGSATTELALDAGELLFLSDWYVERADLVRTEDPGARREQRYFLEEAVETLNAIEMRIPADAEQIEAGTIDSALGREQFSAAPDRFGRQSLQALALAYRKRRDEIDKVEKTAAGEASPRQAAADFSSENARLQALTAIELLKDQLSPILHALKSDRTGEMLANLTPREEDYAKAFVGEAVAAARQAYSEMSVDDMRFPSGAQSQLLCHLAPAGMLLEENELSRLFPGGYRGIAAWLNPHRVWACWKYVRPGSSTGMAYDGLVWLDDHWAWFPKPYRVLKKLLKTREPG